ncbi:hypothetical protein [Zavarzinia aquatilis]|uniref:Uncharacterized protein n=1 Tax=Zavarzinia aquatilis TaxID=2211142 RepID=A0A317DTI4_9PROT|nr:hypothetical protein [Zavarzinia aquatilis]PWR17662.1 hypothetical protein DKG74_20865 [Zavarzinia aquatilis]
MARLSRAEFVTDLARRQLAVERASDIAIGVAADQVDYVLAQGLSPCDALRQAGQLAPSDIGRGQAIERLARYWLALVRGWPELLESYPDELAAADAEGDLHVR